MSSEQIITHCAPTLAGIKTANIFNEYYEDKDELMHEIDNFNKMFSKLGLQMVLINTENNRALIYVFRVEDLKNDFNNGISKSLLNQYGYDTTNIVNSLNRLCGRFSEHKSFPHEIGLFLGYPPEDVKGFIENEGKNYKALGYWKVYGDTKKADETFKKYRTCQKIFLNMFNKGYSLKQLVIQK